MKTLKNDQERPYNDIYLMASPTPSNDQEQNKTILLLIA